MIGLLLPITPRGRGLQIYRTVLINISSFTSPSRSISPSFAMSSVDFGHYFSLPGRDDYGEEREGKDGKVEKCA